MKNTNSKFPAKTKMGAFFHKNEPSIIQRESNPHRSYRSHCGKVQKYNKEKYVSNFLIRCANNVVEKELKS